MNIKIVRNVIGKILFIEGLVMILPLIVSFIYKESSRVAISYFMPIALLIILGGLLAFKNQNDESFYTKEGMVVVALSWLLMSAFGALPFYISGYIPSYIDAFFETVSGFTTTGATVMENVEILPHSLLFWRSFTHLIGGMGILVFALAVLPRTSRQSAQIMKAEVPGPTFGKIVPKISYTARILYVIYLGMTAILVVFLLIGKMPLFDSLIHAFGTAGTGGFSLKAGSIGDYHSSYIHIVTAIGMLLFGINFNIYFFALTGSVREAFKSEELKWYLGIIVFATLTIGWNVIQYYESALIALRDSFFTVTSIITTTGYMTADFDLWPILPKVIIVMLMFIGGCAGSTAGGIKVSRIMIYFKRAVNQIKTTVNPNRVTAVTIENKPVTEEVLKGVSNYIGVYSFLFILFWLLTSVTMESFTTSFTAVTTCFNNVGPGLSAVGPTENFADITMINKIILSVAMLAGRLEIFPVVILLAPSTWRKT